MSGKRRDDMARFDEKWVLDPLTDCHVWIGRKTANGYALFDARDPASDRMGARVAHRWLFQRVHHWSDSQMPPDVCHECDNRACVREQHLWPGTRADNMADMKAKGRGCHVGHRGLLHPCAKLGDGDAEKIRQEYALGGIAQAELGRRYGIKQGAVSRIVRGETWQ